MSLLDKSQPLSTTPLTTSPPAIDYTKYIVHYKKSNAPITDEYYIPPSHTTAASSSSSSASATSSASSSSSTATAASSNGTATATASTQRLITGKIISSSSASSSTSPTAATLPSSFSLEKKIPFIYNQGYNTDTCVANVIALCIAYLNNKYKPSRLFIYYNARVIAGYDVKKDTGLTIKDACKSVELYPPCHESDWDYSIKNITVRPPENAYLKPLLLANFKYFAIARNIEHIKACIHGGNPILFAFMLYSTFYDAVITGRVEMPDLINDRLIGGHCVLIVGYDDKTQRITCANSWGTLWGKRGFFTLPYAYIYDPRLTYDLYTIQFTNTDINTHAQAPCCYCVLQ